MASSKYETILVLFHTETEGPSTNLPLNYPLIIRYLKN